MNITILGLVLLAFAVGAAATAYYVRRWAYQLGYDHGHDMGHAAGWAEGAHDLEDIQAELADLEQRFHALSVQRAVA